MTDLEEIRKRVVVDLDQLDPEIAARLGPFCDMTSNQALIAGAVTSHLDNEEILRVVARAKIEGGTIEERADRVLDLFAVTFAKAVLPHITGRVHAQLSPRYSHSVQLQLDHASRLVSMFAGEGIAHERICLKIPATGAGLVAASIIEAQNTGVRTLLTTLFSVDQAMAAAQAGCLYIAPYFNELSVHFEPETWRDYEDPAKEHPSSSVIREIVEAYKDLPKEKRPLVMPASIVTSKEALAISTLGIDHITISVKVLEALATNDYAQDFSGVATGIDADSASAAQSSHRSAIGTDFLADEGAALDDSNAADESVSRRLTYALQTFGKCEQAIIDHIKPYLL